MRHRLANFLSSLSGSRKPRRRRGARPMAQLVAAEVLEDRVLLAGDAFDTTLEDQFSFFSSSIFTKIDMTAQVVGDFDNQNGDDVANFSEGGSWFVNLNDGNGDFTSQIWSTFPTTTGWQNQVVGDFNGDNFEDIAQFNTFNGTWWVSLSEDDPADADAIPDRFNTQLWDDFQTSSGWVNQLVGDFNDDGNDDIANFNSFNATWWVSIATDTDADNVPDSFVTSLWIDYPTDIGWQNPVVGDFDDDGIDDIAHFNTLNGTWWVNASENAPGGPDDEDSFDVSLWDDFQTTIGWVAQFAGDFNADGDEDIANFNSLNNTWHVSASNVDNEALSPAAQETFSTRLWGQLPSGNYTNHLVGDFNNDFADDVASFDANTGRWYIGLSNDGQFDVDVWSDFPTNGGWTFQNAGDFNDNGALDGIMNFNDFTSSLWQSVGNFGFSNETDVTLDGSATHESTINVTGPLGPLSGTIIDVNVQIDLFHPNISDLNAVLVSPTGVEVGLFFDVIRDDSDELDRAFFDDEAAVAVRNGIPSSSERRLRPEGNLSNFDGLDPNGTWTLRIVDDNPALNDGVLNSWNLILKTATT